MVDEGALTTDETWRYFRLGDDLAVPFMDPQGGIGNPENGGYAVRQLDGTWQTFEINSPYAVHVYGMRQTSEGWWACGASQVGDPATASDGQVWFSDDQGATWTASLTVPGTDDQCRVYCLLGFGDDILAVSVNHDTGQSKRWLRVAAGAWVEQTHDNTPLADWAAFTYLGTPFYLGFQHGRDTGQVTPASFIDVWTHPDDDSERATIRATLPFDSALDAAVTSDGLHLYVLDGFMVLHRGDQAGAWEVIDPGVDISTATALAVDDIGGWLYFGTIDSRLFRAPIPA